MNRYPSIEEQGNASFQPVCNTLRAGRYDCRSNRRPLAGEGSAAVARKPIMTIRLAGTETLARRTLRRRPHRRQLSRLLFVAAVRGIHAARSSAIPVTAASRASTAVGAYRPAGPAASQHTAPYVRILTPEMAATQEPQAIMHGRFACRNEDQCRLAIAHRDRMQQDAAQRSCRAIEEAAQDRDST